MRAAGFPRTIAIWHSYMDNATLTWRRNALHENTFMMPRQGLVEKVLRDRVEEMVAPFWNVGSPAFRLSPLRAAVQGHFVSCNREACSVPK